MLSEFLNINEGKDGLNERNYNIKRIFANKEL